MMTVIKRIVGETFENLKNEKGMFFSTLITMTIIFLVLSFIVAYTINLKSISDFIKKNMQIKVYIDDNLTSEGISNIEKSLLKYEEISSVKFISKEIALKQIMNELNLNFEFKENPLRNVFLINIEEGVNVENLITKLKGEAGVVEIDDRFNFIFRLNKIIYTIKNITIYIYIAIALPVFIIIFNLIANSILRRKEDIEIMTLVGATAWYIKWPFILESLIHVVLATSISMFIFVPLYNFFKESVELILPFISLMPTEYITKLVFTIIGAFGGVVTFIASYISIKANIKMYGD